MVWSGCQYNSQRKSFGWQPWSPPPQVPMAVRTKWLLQSWRKGTGFALCFLGEKPPLQVNRELPSRLMSTNLSQPFGHYGHLWQQDRLADNQPPAKLRGCPLFLLPTWTISNWEQRFPCPAPWAKACQLVGQFERGELTWPPRAGMNRPLGTAPLCCPSTSLTLVAPGHPVTAVDPPHEAAWGHTVPRCTNTTFSKKYLTRLPWWPFCGGLFPEAVWHHIFQHWLVLRSPWKMTRHVVNIFP